MADHEKPVGRLPAAVSDEEFADVAQMIQRRTGCGGLTSNDVTAAVMLMLGITECEGRKIGQPEFRHDYLPGADHALPSTDLSSAPENTDLLLWGQWDDGWGLKPLSWVVGQKWSRGAGWHVMGNTMSLRFRPICWMLAPPSGPSDQKPASSS